MTKKRRNSGRNKPAGARGSVRRVRCEQSGVLVPKDKAIKRFIVRNIVDASAVRDIQDASALEGKIMPEHDDALQKRPVRSMTPTLVCRQHSTAQEKNAIRQLIVCNI